MGQLAKTVFDYSQIEDKDVRGKMTYFAGAIKNKKRIVEYIPDPIERGEARCEDWLFDSKVGDKHRCSCGRLFSLEDGETVSADPYAIPVCLTCFGEWWDSHGGRTKDKR